MTRNYYDVKMHFLSAVPLVMFIRATFRDVMWRPNELGACLIIDDPLLKPRYGFCDFRWLRDQMRERGFTTSVAFIPWNWRRTTQRASELFRSESDLFSVSIHGCDHVAAEFGATSTDILDRSAGLASERMDRHAARTRINHDPVMVFPQGVFSSACPAVLKRHNFIAAINTEISPSDDTAAQTRVRDAWDVAILRYGAFAIYTRRYERHGLENFAFDLLLGKPCFIVAHHDEFRDRAVRLLDLIDRLHALSCQVRWRSVGEVVRRAYRLRNTGGAMQVRMYATEAWLANGQDHEVPFETTRMEVEADAVSNVTANQAPADWFSADGYLHFRCIVPPGERIQVRVGYRGRSEARVARSVRYGLSVTARRLLCEFRDQYVHTFPWGRGSGDGVVAAR